MTTYNTGNAVPSFAVRDLYDNSQTEDEVVNSDALTTVTRTGKVIKTFAGFEDDFQQFLLASGYEFLGDYDDPGELTFQRRNQMMSKDGEYWRPGPSLALPYTTVNNWVIDEPKFVGMGDASLRQALALSSGAGLVGFSSAAPYPANTVGLAVKGRRSIYQFGAIVSGGVTNNLATFQAAAAGAGAGVIDCRNLGTIRIDGSVSLRTDQFWDCSGTKIVTANTAQDVFFIDQTDNTVLVRPHITGPGGAVFSGGSGIHVNDATNWRVIDPTVVDSPGYGFYVSPGANTSNRGDHGVVTNPRIKGCGIGMKDSAGSGAEYYTIINPHITGCLQAGLAISAGNVVVMGGHVLDNPVAGLYLGAGSNQGHGIITGVNFNHNGVWNLEAHDVLNGQSILGCHFYAVNSIGAGGIWLDRCKGIDINGGVLEGWIYNYKDASSGMNMIRNMYCPGDYGPVALTPGANNGLDQLWVTQCYGLGAVVQATGVSINDPGIVNVRAIRVPGAGQTISGSTQLIYNQEDYDRRLAYNVATGLFTVPAGQAGRYRIEGTAVFNGTGLTATSSYVEVAVGATLIDFSPCVPFSTTKLAAKFFAEVTLIAGDTVAIKGNVTGTTPTFGDATYRSTLSITRIG